MVKRIGELLHIHSQLDPFPVSHLDEYMKNPNRPKIGITANQRRTIPSVGFEAISHVANKKVRFALVNKL